MPHRLSLSEQDPDCSSPVWCASEPQITTLAQVTRTSGRSQTRPGKAGPAARLRSPAAAHEDPAASFRDPPPFRSVACRPPAREPGILRAEKEIILKHRLSLPTTVRGWGDCAASRVRGRRVGVTAGATAAAAGCRTRGSGDVK